MEYLPLEMFGYPWFLTHGTPQYCLPLPDTSAEQQIKFDIQV